MKKSLIALVPLLLATALIGCGPPRVNVKGKVTYGAKTIKYGEVVFFGSDGVPKTAKIGKDGTYEITDIAGGDLKIAVRSLDPKSVPTPDRKPPDPEDLKNWFPIAMSYGDVESSGLTAKLSAKDNEHNITMTERGK